MLNYDVFLFPLMQFILLVEGVSSIFSFWVGYNG